MTHIARLPLRQGTTTGRIIQHIQCTVPIVESTAATANFELIALKRWLRDESSPP